jgi:methylenetetrahydrofolate reductase (NADPH)
LKTFEQAIAKENFVITAEISSPISCGPKELEDKIDILKGTVHAINITDNPGATAHMSSLVGSAIVIEKGIDPILQITCRDRNRLAIQSDLMGASALGINNVLTLGGDPIKNGDQPDAKAVFDVNSKTLLTIMKNMNETGETMSGRMLSTKGSFFPGSAAIVHDPTKEWDPKILNRKAELGTKFIQTQFCYDIDILKNYMKHIVDAGLTDKLAFIIGIGPFKTGKTAQWMKEKLFGTIIPDAMIRRMDQANDKLEEGIIICAELIDQLQDIDGVSGAHLMAPRNLSGIAASVKRAGITIS